MPYQPASQLTKHCTKRCLEFKNNAVGHMTFVHGADMSASNTIYVLYPYICTCMLD